MPKPGILFTSVMVMFPFLSARLHQFLVSAQCERFGLFTSLLPVVDSFGFRGDAGVEMADSVKTFLHDLVRVSLSVLS